jgi:hypothetical protein
MAKIWEGMLISSPSEDAESSGSGERTRCWPLYAISDEEHAKARRGAYLCFLGGPRDTHARCAEVSR